MMESVWSKHLWQLNIVCFVLIIALVPFDGFLPIVTSKLLGHYTLWRLWDDALLIISLVSCFILLGLEPKGRQRLFKNRLFWLILAYFSLQIIWGVVSFRFHNVSAKALGYGLIVNLRFLAFFLTVWLTFTLKKPAISLGRLVIWPAVIVAVFGLLQVFVLPHNFLSHFGYGPNTISPYETINHNRHYIRAQSTTRGANPLAAYLLIPISFLAVWLSRKLKDYKALGLIIILSATLFFSFSRSAWLAFVVITGIVVVSHVTEHPKSKIYALSGLAVAVVLAIGLFLALHNNPRFQNLVFHTEHNSSIKSTSDQGHESATTTGLKELFRQPFGRGPGTAGPASVYNNHPSRIAENYFIQVGQEVGWLGLAIFLAINVIVGYWLWQRRQDGLALTLLLALIGASIVNLLSHAWTDDTLAFMWWGLAGAALGLPKRDNFKGVY